MDERELFKGTAPYYSMYRLGYLPEFFDYIANYFNLNRKGKLLDLGCGTGQLTIPLAKYFEAVIGIDPEQEMLDEAQKQKDKTGIKNITLVRSNAEDISCDLGTFKLTTIGAAFHWMKQAEVLQKIYNLTEKGGGLVLVYDSAGLWATKDNQKEEWKQAVRNTIKKYLGEKRRAGNSFYKKSERAFTDLIDESSFGMHEMWTHIYTRKWTLESILGFLYSTSFASRRLFGSRLVEFENELTTLLLKIEPTGIFEEQSTIEAILTKKN
ncbi:MAG: class I SAM-dependent methyltransferase [Candidatus Taylorbacteria bacterium]|nr:class I SAM-dependent methyltransferase [Candidatus Taylorbacteria bacterium]